MNCIILLLLLSCCSGWGNGGGCCNGWNNNDGCGDCGCRVPVRRAPERRGPERRGADRRPDECCCEEEKHSRDNCGCEKEERERERESCEVQGMIPPPWQEYPGFPRRESRSDENCDACD